MTGLDPARCAPVVVVRLMTSALDVGAAHEDVLHPEAGGIGVFTGVVRNHHGGEAVSHLVYEAWEEQAIAAMQRVADEVVAAHPGVRAVHVSHRTGHLDVGDIAVICAASAPHRAEALAAATQLIDRVKDEVPIWKHETLADGRTRWPRAGDHDV